MKAINLKNTEETPAILEAFDLDRVVQDYIRQYKNLLSDDECQQVIDSHKDAEWYEIDVNGRRLCDATRIKEGEIDDLLFTKFSSILTMYATDFWRAGGYNIDTGYTLLRYNQGDYCPLHVEPSGSTIRASIILNDAKGGETRFFAKEMIDSSAGTGFAFPSSFMFPYEVLPVLQGTRYMVVTSFK